VLIYTLTSFLGTDNIDPTRVRMANEARTTAKIEVVVLQANNYYAICHEVFRAIENTGDPAKVVVVVNQLDVRSPAPLAMVWKRD
jgi:hypothetical protein